MNLAAAAELVAIGSGVGAGGLWLVRGGHWIGTLKSHLDRLDKGQKALFERLTAVEAELKPNHGSSHHDQLVRRIEERTTQEEIIRELVQTVRAMAPTAPAKE